MFRTYTARFDMMRNMKHFIIFFELNKAQYPISILDLERDKRQNMKAPCIFYAVLRNKIVFSSNEGTYIYTIIDCENSSFTKMELLSRLQILAYKSALKALFSSKNFVKSTL